MMKMKINGIIDMKIFGCCGAPAGAAAWAKRRRLAVFINEPWRLSAANLLARPIAALSACPSAHRVD
jgi:hypothetical protein